MRFGPAVKAHIPLPCEAVHLARIMPFQPVDDLCRFSRRKELRSKSGVHLSFDYVAPSDPRPDGLAQEGGSGPEFLCSPVIPRGLRLRLERVVGRVADLLVILTRQLVAPNVEVGDRQPLLGWPPSGNLQTELAPCPAEVVHRLKRRN